MIHPINATFQEKAMNIITTAGIMAKGILWFIVIAYLAWLWNNFDVQLKAMRYPETVRKLQITVSAAQH